MHPPTGMSSLQPQSQTKIRSAGLKAFLQNYGATSPRWILDASKALNRGSPTFHQQYLLDRRYIPPLHRSKRKLLDTDGIVQQCLLYALRGFDCRKFAGWTLHNLATQTGQDKLTHSSQKELSPTSKERMRFTRARYRFQLLCQLLKIDHIYLRDEALFSFFFALEP